MRLIKWNMLSESEKHELLNQGLILMDKDVRFELDTLNHIKQYIGNDVEQRRTNGKNRKSDKNYLRVECYLTKEYKQKLKDIKNIKGGSISSIIEDLIDSEMVNLLNK